MKADLDAARAEARSIARAGGTAEVHYITPTGEREVIATYRPGLDLPVPSAGSAAWVAIKPASLALLLAGGVLLLWLMRRYRNRQL